MSAPVTNGVERTKLSDMKVGDYIKGKCVSDGNTLSITVENVESTASELSPTRSSTYDGYLYFLKVDPGMLIADRFLNLSSYQWLNKVNCFKGQSIRILTIAEHYKYILNSDLNGNISKGSTLVWKYIFTVFPFNDAIFQDTFTNSNKLGLYINSGSVEHSRVSDFSNVGATTEGGIDGYYWMPVMEYVDNSKSTNIYY